MINKKGSGTDYEQPKLSIFFLWQDVVTLSGGENGEGNLGSDLGEGQIGSGDIFD